MIAVDVLRESWARADEVRFVVVSALTQPAGGDGSSIRYENSSRNCTWDLTYSMQMSERST
jgi:hypothetical protein